MTGINLTIPGKAGYMFTLLDVFSLLDKTFSAPLIILFMIQHWFHFTVAILVCLNFHFSLESPRAEFRDAKENTEVQSWAEEFIKAALCRQNKYSHNHSILIQMDFFVCFSICQSLSAVCYVNVTETLTRIQGLNGVSTLRRKKHGAMSRNTQT